jgi:hypothetical protein
MELNYNGRDTGGSAPDATGDIELEQVGGCEA